MDNCVKEMEKNKEYTEEELKVIGIDLAEDKIFTNFHVRNSDQEMMGQIFIPLLLGAFKDFSDEQKKEISMIFEYYDKAGPRRINGYPFFSSFR